jgi:uncharacterized UPF0160 family protein
MYDLELEYKIDPLVKFDLSCPVHGSGQAFENRLSLPEEWRGVRDQELEAVTKIPESRFCHVAGFIGGASTYEGKSWKWLESP